MKIAHGLLTWQDGRELLERCLRSTVPYVDHVLIAEGLIEGVPGTEQLPIHSDLAWLAEPSDWLPDSLPISSREAPKVDENGRIVKQPGVVPWMTLSGKMNWLLGEARRRGCDWLLVCDADEELVNGGALRNWLEGWPRELAAFPISRRPQPGMAPKRSPWHLVRIPLIRRYVCGVGFAELTDGRVVWLLDDGAAGPEAELFTRTLPWIDHHPELRPAWRRAIRLGDWETMLEPAPANAEVLRLPALVGYSPHPMNVAATAPGWYCPGCGSRAWGPGACTNNHPPIERVEEEDKIVAASEPPAAEPVAGETAAPEAPQPTVPQPEPQPAEAQPAEPEPAPQPVTPEPVSAAGPAPVIEPRPPAEEALINERSTVLAELKTVTARALELLGRL